MITPEEAEWNENLVDRRRRQDEGSRDPLFNGVPAWVKGIAVVGIPGTIALFLVYQNATQQPKIAEQLAALTSIIRLDHETRQQDAIKTEQLYRMLQAICSNTAKTEEARIACR